MKDVVEVLHSSDYVDFVKTTYKGARVAKG